MSGHHNFETLRSRMSPERRARNAAAADELHREYVLSQIRREVGLTQVEMAERLSISQPTYAEYEKGDNMRLGTLTKIVKALGGILKIQVAIDGKDYPLEFSNTRGLANA